MRILRILAASLASLFLLGTGLTLFLTVLTGGTQTSILKKFYWLEVDCSNFPGSPFNSNCRWTNYGLCGVTNNENSNCTHAVAAYPFSPSKNFNSNTNLPNAFITNSNYYYYTSRIGFGFSLVGLAFLVFSWLPYFLILFIRNSFKAFKTIFWVFYTASSIFIIIGIALSTSSYAKGRSHFRDAGYTSNLGTKAMSTAWVTVFLLLFNIPFLVSSLIDFKFSGLKSKHDDYESNPYITDNDNTNNNNKGGWFKKYRKNQHELSQPVQQPVTPVINNDANVETSGNTTTSANYLSFTPVKEAKPVTSDLEEDKTTGNTLYH